MSERTLMDGFRVTLNKCMDAGTHSLHRVESFREILTFNIGPGQPYYHAYVEAERLAVLLDAQFVVCGKIVRESLTAKYYEKQEAPKAAEAF